MRVGLLTYSTKPRGGVVHTLALGEALQQAGVHVHVFALGPSGGRFYRETSLPFTLYPSVADAVSLDEKVFRSVDSMADGLRATVNDLDIMHAQDCISARAATRVRNEQRIPPVVRTVHHVDDFTTKALIDCQRKAIVEPDHLLVVSRMWQRILADEFGFPAEVVPNGVDPARFAPIAASQRAKIRQSVDCTTRPLIVAVGGIEPRKGTRDLFEALAIMKEQGVDATLALLGGHSFQDYRDYRKAALARAEELGLSIDRDIIEIGTVDDATLNAWYRSADALAMPSRKEGFGLVALEGLAADVPVVVSDLPVFQEFLEDGTNAKLARTGDAHDIARCLREVITSPELRDRLIEGGRKVLPRYTWQASATRHQEIYATVHN